MFYSIRHFILVSKPFYFSFYSFFSELKINNYLLGCIVFHLIRILYSIYFVHYSCVLKILLKANFVTMDGVSCFGSNNLQFV